MKPRLLDPRMDKDSKSVYPSREATYRREYGQRKYRDDAEYRERLRATERTRKRRILGIPEATKPMTVCEICGAADSGITKAGNRRRLHVDHDHATGMFRGWLCGNCNLGIGMLRDDPVLLEEAIRYLRAHTTSHNLPRRKAEGFCGSAERGGGTE